MEQLQSQALYTFINYTLMSNSRAPSPISEQEWSILQQFLTSDKVDDALDTIETHGLLCSIAVGPVELELQELLGFILGGQPRYTSHQEEEQIVSLLKALENHIKFELASGNRVNLPCKLSLYPVPAKAPLRAWASGFMEGLMAYEDHWFNRDEETIAQLSLPILVASGLAEEEEILALEKNKSLCNKLSREIPETLTDMFLFFNS